MANPSRLAAGVLTATSLAALASCGSAPADPRTQPRLVEVTSVAPDGGGDASFAGIVTARVQSDLGFRVAGKVVERLVDTGERVRRGQPLLRIDGADLELARNAQVGEVAAVRAKAIQTDADERRLRDLVSAGAVSASAYDQAKAAAEAARSQLVAAQAQARVAGNASNYSVLRADADGIVVETLAEPGQVVAPGQTVVRLARSGPREAVVGLPETVRPRIGTVAGAVLFGSTTRAMARLRQLSDSADPATRTYEARFILQGSAASAPLGSTVTVSFPQSGKPMGLQVPISAIFDAGRGPGVWMVGRSAHPTVTWRPVRLTAVGSETATISGGIGSGERFVAVGAHMLHQGETVRVSDTKVIGQ